MILLAALLITGCSLDQLSLTASDPTPAIAEGSGRITANPNPVPAGSGQGSTTITWDSGDGTEAQVYVTINDGPEQLFAYNVKGSKDAPWIQAGSAYEFRLYAGSENKKLLARVVVRRNAN